MERGGICAIVAAAKRFRPIFARRHLSMFPGAWSSTPTETAGSDQVVASPDRSKRDSILIVEDDALVSSYIEAVLDDSGFEVAGRAASAPEALSLAANLRPRLALVDIRLMGPVDGIELACQLREKCGVPSIFLTGLDDAATIARSQTARPLGFLAKPARPSQIFHALESVFAQTRD